MDDSVSSQNIKLKKTGSSASQNLKSEKLILRVSFIGSALFLLLEFVAAFLTHSQAVLMDCVYDLVDLAMLGPFMILVPRLYKPVTEKWPYGLSQIEPLFIIIKCGLLLFLDIQLMTDSIQIIAAGGNEVNAGAVAAFELFISVSCITMFIVLRHLNKKFSSPTVNAELYIWKLDAYSTGGVGLAFLISLIMQQTPLAWVAPYIDPAIAIFLAVVLIKEPVTMIYESVRSLILAAPSQDVVDDIRETTEASLKTHDFDIDFLDVVKTGRKIWVDIYIIPDGDIISMSSLKQAHDEIIDKLKPKYNEIIIELIPEIDPEIANN